VLGTDLTTSVSNAGNRTLTVLRKGGKIVTIRSPHAPHAPST